MDPVILRLLGVLEQMHESKGVPKEDGLVNKNVIKSDNSTFDSGNKKKSGLNSKDKKTLVETFNLFNQMFFAYQKKMQVDTKEKTLVSSIAQSQVKQSPPPLPAKGKESSGGFLKTLLGGLGLLGGLVAFLYGLMTDGPLKGILKLLSKLGIVGGLKMLKSAISSLGHFIGKIFKFPIEIIKKLGKGIFGDVFKTISTGIKSFIGSIGKGLSGVVGKILPKGGKGFFGKLTGSILKVLKPAAKLLKRIPIIGTLISVGFAISRFKSGDTVGGIIDVLSGLVGLLDIVVPGLGFGLSLGLDVLNAFLDVKAGGSNPQASKKKSDILWDMAKGLGSWIWENAEYIPVLGSIKWFGKAYESFTGGSYLEGIKQIGLGLISIVPGGGLLIKGVEMLMGFFSSKSEKDPTLNANKSWYSKLKDWVKSKLNNLPWWIKKPLSWFGIMEDDSGMSTPITDTIDGGVKAGFEKTKEFFGSIWNTIKGSIGNAITIIGDFSSDVWNKTKEFASKAWNSIKEMAPQVWETIKNTVSNAWSSVKEMAPKIWQSVKDVTSKAWDKTKEYTSDAWNAVTAEAPKIWQSVKDIGNKAWDKAKEAGSWFSETMSSMANKTKNLVNEWIPKIVDTVTSVTDGAMKVLKNIADKIGSWISGLFTSDEERKLQSAKVNTPINESENFLAKDSNEATHLLVKGNGVANTWLENISKASLEQVRLLGMLVNVGNSSLGELRRMSGNSGGGGGTVIMTPPQQSQKTPMISIDNNRMGFAGSPYALS